MAFNWSRKWFLHWTRNFLCCTVTMDLPWPFNDFYWECVITGKLCDYDLWNHHIFLFWDCSTGVKLCHLLCHIMSGGCENWSCSQCTDVLSQKAFLKDYRRFWLYVPSWLTLSIAVKYLFSFYKNLNCKVVLWDLTDDFCSQSWDALRMSQGGMSHFLP